MMPTTQPIRFLQEDEVRALRPWDDPGFGALSTAQGRLPLRRMDVRAKISGLVAAVTLRQTFHNAFSSALEATYIFPLPDRAAVHAFQVEVGGRRIVGRVKEREQAREEYDQAIAAGAQAAIAEEERPGVFTVRVGNLLPGQDATVEFRLVWPLPVDAGVATFRFPLVVAPRYIPGVALPGEQAGDGTARDTDAVPDASRISPPVLLPGFPSPVRLSFEVEIGRAGLPLEGVASSLHELEANSTSEALRLALRPGERLNRDFILQLALTPASLSPSLLCRQDGDEGTFLLTLIPPPPTGESKPRDVVFVLDRSGSMRGWKMIAARRAVARLVEGLGSRDRMAILAFDNVIEGPAFGTGLVPADAYHRTRAVEYLFGVEARGGTEMLQPLSQGAEILRARRGSFFKAPEERERSIVLLTDGQVGNEDQIVRALGAETDLRVCTVGIDTAVNAAFLHRLAKIGSGRCELVESESRLEAAMEGLGRLLLPPVLTQLELVAGAFPLDRGSLAPARLPDVFFGAPVQISGRYQGEPLGKLALRGTRPDGSSQVFELPIVWEEEAPLSTLWAKAHLRDLEDRYTIGEGDRAAIERRIVEVSTRFQVLSRFTAFVAVDWETLVNPGGHQHRALQAVETPDGWGGQNVNRTTPRREQEAKKRTMAVVESRASMAPPPAPGAPPPSAAYRSAPPAPASPAPMRGKAITLSTPATERARGITLPAPAPMPTAAPPAAPQGGSTPTTGRRPPQPGNRTQTGTIRGSVEYLSPERVRGEKAGAASDVFELGLILYALLTGEALYQRESAFVSLSAILTEPLPDFASDPRTAPLAAVLRRALAKDPAARYAHVGEMMAALHPALAGATRDALRAALLQRAGSLLDRRAQQELEAVRETQIANIGPLRLVASLRQDLQHEDFLASWHELPMLMNTRKAQGEIAGDPQAEQDFLREASFPHANTVQWMAANDFGNGNVFLTRYYEKGLWLEELLDEVGPQAALPAPLAAQLVHDVAMGLEFARTKGGQLHGDLSPRSVWIRWPAAEAQVSGFGPAVRPEFVVTRTIPPTLLAPEAPVRTNPPRPPATPPVTPPVTPPEPPKRRGWKFWK